MDTNIDSTFKWQEEEDKMQNLSAFCLKIQQGIADLGTNAGERAIWELIQNARDMAENAHIRMTLTPDKFVFAHKGKPFDYKSLNALVKQMSSKGDDPNADNVGQYGTGFMTTHAFNDIVKISGSYKARPDEVGYVRFHDFVLDRSHESLKDAVDEMDKELRQVKSLYKEPKADTPAEWTTFTYELDSTQVTKISEQLESVIKLIPFVLVINARIQILEIENHVTEHKVSFSKRSENHQDIESIEGCQHVISVVELVDNGCAENLSCHSLQAANGDDIVFIPPFPRGCEDLSEIPSLFLWFPLLGTEKFGVNFIFHSKRFYPVEKRNNIQLPIDRERLKNRYTTNEEVLHMMGDAVLQYYSNPENAQTLPMNFCAVRFPINQDDPVTKEFYVRLQEKWEKKMVEVMAIPIEDGFASVNTNYMRVMHHDLYNNLDEDQRKSYEPILRQYAAQFVFRDGHKIVLPSENLIQWSEIIDELHPTRNVFLTPTEICSTIKQEDENLLQFLQLLKDCGSTNCFQTNKLIPNRDGELCLQNNLRIAAFMTDEWFNVVSPLMGMQRSMMINPLYTGIADFGEYKAEELQSAIQSTIGTWRNESISSVPKKDLDIDNIKSLIRFCSIHSQADASNLRTRLVPIIAELYDETYELVNMPCPVSDERNFYKSAFTFLSECALFTLSCKDCGWVAANRDLLLRFVTEYTSSKDEDWLKKLDTYGVIPNQLNHLCLLSELVENAGIPEELETIYQQVLRADLKAHWIAEDFRGLVKLKGQEPKEVAMQVEKVIEDALKERQTTYDKVLLKLIPMLTDKTWQDWFEHINSRKESIVFNLKSGDTQKALFSIMDMDDFAIRDLADLKDSNDLSLVLLYGKQEMARQRQEERDWEYKKQLGWYVEHGILAKLNAELKGHLLSMPPMVRDEQGGQDIIVSLDDQEIFYIEIKSRWSTDRSVLMSQTQHRNSIEHMDCYALCAADMCDYDRTLTEEHEMTPEEMTELLSHVRVLTNIGELNARLADATDMKKMDSVHVAGGYQVLVPQALIDDKGKDFDSLLDAIQSVMKRYV